MLYPFLHSAEKTSVFVFIVTFKGKKNVFVHTRAILSIVNLQAVYWS